MKRPTLSPTMSSPSSMTPHAPHKLVQWYEMNARPLPWRQTQDPYRILLSETMLQQTRVDTAIPYYHAFLKKFPTVADLANADEEHVLKAWQGLGYYSRARNLHRAARKMMEHHGGEVPQEPKALSSLPGIGDYTQGAVLSIAFNQPTPAVDGNVLRVVARFQGIRETVDSPDVKREVGALVAEWLHSTEPRVLTQAIMELGALVCTPRSPTCSGCPLQTGCVAYRDELTDELPVKRAKKPRRVVDVTAIWLEKDGSVLVQKRVDSGLLAGMWQLPAVESTQEEAVSPAAALSEIANAAFGWGQEECSLSALGDDAYMLLAKEKHVFTHLEWYVSLYRPLAWDGLCDNPAESGIIRVKEPFQWVPVTDLALLPWPRVYDKILEYILRPTLF